MARCSCQMTYLVRVFGVNLPEAAGGRLAEWAGLEKLRSWRRGSLMAQTGRWAAAGRRRRLLHILVDLCVVEVFFSLATLLVTLSASENKYSAPMRGRNLFKTFQNTFQVSIAVPKLSKELKVNTFRTEMPYSWVLILQITTIPYKHEVFVLMLEHNFSILLHVAD